MINKLRIDLPQGELEIEGEADLVREVYADFKVVLLSNIKPHDSDINAEEAKATHTKKDKKPKSRRSTLKKGGNKNTKRDSDFDPPKMDKDLDLKDLSSYFEGFKLKNHPERILVFLNFLSENLGIEQPNTNQIFTCYRRVKCDLPKAFFQAFRDTSRQGYIDYHSPTKMNITMAGMNHFDHLRSNL